MTSVLAAPNALKGEQLPRVCLVPECASSTGQEAVELCRMAGLILDPWEEFVLVNSLGERADGRWAAFEVGLNVARQNGKGAILEARELTGLFLLNERLIIHSAHEFPTSLEHFIRLLYLIENTPDFSRRVKRVSRSHGEEGIDLKGGQRIRFRTRTKGGGRGFTGDLLILDEAMELAEAFHGALFPTLSGRSIVGNPQVWYTGSAVDQEVHDNGIVFARVRERGHRGDPSLAYFEWSADYASPEDVTDPTDPALWAQANPGLGIRISGEHIASEHRSMAARSFAVERLGVGDWPRTDGLGEVVINPEDWRALTDPTSQPRDPLVFAFDVTPTRSRATIAAAARREDGLFHVEVVDRRLGTGWVTERLAELVEKHRPDSVICDGKGPAATLIHELEPLGVTVTKLTLDEYAQACGYFFDLVDQQSLRHLGTPELNAAIKGAAKRPLGDRWAWSRKDSTVDISPLVSCTLALWGTAHASGGGLVY